MRDARALALATALAQLLELAPADARGELVPAELAEEPALALDGADIVAESVAEGDAVAAVEDDTVCERAAEAVAAVDAETARGVVLAGPDALAPGLAVPPNADSVDEALGTPEPLAALALAQALPTAVPVALLEAEAAPEGDAALLELTLELAQPDALAAPDAEAGPLAAPLGETRPLADTDALAAGESDGAPEGDDDPLAARLAEPAALTDGDLVDDVERDALLLRAPLAEADASPLAVAMRPPGLGEPLSLGDALRERLTAPLVLAHALIDTCGEPVAPPLARGEPLGEPEAAALEVRRTELPNIHALNFVVVGLLGEGVASSTAFDAQAKGLGEYLLSRVWRG